MKNIVIFKPLRDFIKVKTFLRTLDITFLPYLLPVSLGLLAAFFEGACTVLLVPIAKCVLFGNLDFFKASKYFKHTAAALPGLFDSYAVGFITLLAALYLCIIAKSILLYVSAVMFSTQTRIFTNNLRKAIFERYLSFGKLFFDRANIG